MIKISVSLGELCDRISILMIKKNMIKDEAKNALIKEQLDIANKELDSYFSESGISDELVDTIQFRTESSLVTINSKLWKVEDLLRIHEKNQDFGTEFINLARSVYHYNDERHNMKTKIDRLVGSTLIEQKEYVTYEKAIIIS